MLNTMAFLKHINIYFSIFTILSLINVINLSAQNKPINENRVFNVPISVDSIYGYSVYASRDSQDIQIVKDGRIMLRTNLYGIDDYYLRWAKELDSIDIVKGFAMARALTEPAVGEADGCYSEKKIDSLCEFRSTSGLRCFYTHAIMKTYCDGRLEGSSYYYGFVVDLSQGNNIQLLQIPNSFIMSNDDPKLIELCWLLIDKLKRR